jgi:hypothetical protein
MEDKRVKNWILIYSMLDICRPLECKYREAFIKFHIPPGQICGLVMQSNSTSRTATKQAHKVDSNDVNHETDQNEGEISQKEVLNHKHKAPGPGPQASNGPN